jgi:predicted heme/steroid binding protein
MEKKQVIRLIIEEREDVIYWDDDVDQKTLQEVVVYIIDQLRKKYSTDTFTIRDIESSHYPVEQIAEFGVSPLFLTIPNRKDVKTYVKVDPRTFKNVYIFKDNNSIRIQKFESLKRYEEVEIKIPVIQSMNESNKKVKFEDSSLAADFVSMKIEVKTPEDESLPTFGGAKSSGQTKGLLKPDALLLLDLSKRQKIPFADGKSQADFIKMNENNKNPLGKPVELKLYTLDEVKQHKTVDDCWMILNGKVYDVTKYIPFHPGGKKMMAAAGKDGTELYNKYHPWVNANFLLEKYHIGFVKK